MEFVIFVKVFLTVFEQVLTCTSDSLALSEVCTHNMGRKNLPI